MLGEHIQVLHSQKKQNKKNLERFHLVRARKYLNFARETTTFLISQMTKVKLVLTLAWRKNV